MVKSDAPDTHGCRGTAPTRAVTVMFTDLEGFTVMSDRLGDQTMHAVMIEHHAVIRRHAARHGGVVEAFLGDGFMIMFAEPRDGLACAVAIQRSVGRLSRRLEIDLRVRIGLHHGPVLVCAGGYFGRTITVAARIASLARGRQILVSEGLRDEAAHVCVYGRPVRRRLKGLRQPRQVSEVKWDVPSVPTRTAGRVAPASLGAYAPGTRGPGRLGAEELVSVG